MTGYSGEDATTGTPGGQWEEVGDRPWDPPHKDHVDRTTALSSHNTVLLLYDVTTPPQAKSRGTSGRTQPAWEISPEPFAESSAADVTVRKTRPSRAAQLLERGRRAPSPYAVSRSRSRRSLSSSPVSDQTYRQTSATERELRRLRTSVDDLKNGQDRIMDMLQNIIHVFGGTPLQYVKFSKRSEEERNALVKMAGRALRNAKEEFKKLEKEVQEFEPKPGTQWLLNKKAICEALRADFAECRDKKVQYEELRDAVEYEIRKLWLEKASDTV